MEEYAAKEYSSESDTDDYSGYAYVMLTTFISYFTLLVLWLSGKTE